LKQVSCTCIENIEILKYLKDSKWEVTPREELLERLVNAIHPLQPSYPTSPADALHSLCRDMAARPASQAIAAFNVIAKARCPHPVE
jgi:hypothetical protein